MSGGRSLSISVALAQVDDGAFASSQSDGVNFSWLPLIAIDVHGLWLGLDIDGDWVVGRPGGMAAKSEERLPSGWVCVLDMTESDFFHTLQASCEKYKLPSDMVLKRVPVDEVLTLALRSGSGHWVQRATQWLLARTPNSEHLDLLRAIIAMKRMPQKARQSAVKIINSAT